LIVPTPFSRNENRNSSALLDGHRQAPSFQCGDGFRSPPRPTRRRGAGPSTSAIAGKCSRDAGCHAAPIFLRPPCTPRCPVDEKKKNNGQRNGAQRTQPSNPGKKRTPPKEQKNKRTPPTPKSYTMSWGALPAASTTATTLPTLDCGKKKTNSAHEVVWRPAPEQRPTSDLPGSRRGVCSVATGRVDVLPLVLGGFFGFFCAGTHSAKREHRQSSAHPILTCLRRLSAGDGIHAR